MNILANLCCFVLLPYWVLAMNTYEEMPDEDQELLGESSGDPGVSDSLYDDRVFCFWFKQKLDHFLSTETSTWQQRYYLNKMYHKRDGPVFLLVGGLIEIYEIEIQQGAWIEYAEKIGAIIFYVEHRFYGQSQPTTDLDTKNFVYLNSEQALADLAWFIVSMREKFQECISPTTKWIAFGVTFGGTLAARLRLKYPHLIYAAVTSSSAFMEVANFKVFFEVIENVIAKHPRVEDRIKEAFQMIQTEIDNGNTIILAEKFNMCTFLETHDKAKNISYFFWNLSNALALVMQYGKCEHAELKRLVMNIMANGPYLNALDRLASAIQGIIDYFSIECLAVDYKLAVEAYKNTSWTAQLAMDLTLSGGLGNRQYLYQRCTEFGQFETSDQISGLFSHHFPEEFFVGICTDVFGEEFDSRRLSNGIARSAMFYGGADIEVSRVVFVNGGEDPWSYLGIIVSKPNERFAIFIPHATHCEDVRSENDLPELITYRQLIFEKLLQWLNR